MWNTSQEKTCSKNALEKSRRGCSFVVPPPTVTAFPSGPIQGAIVERDSPLLSLAVIKVSVSYPLCIMWSVTYLIPSSNSFATSSPTEKLNF